MRSRLLYQDRSVDGSIATRWPQSEQLMKKKNTEEKKKEEGFSVLVWLGQSRRLSILNTQRGLFLS